MIALAALAPYKLAAEVAVFGALAAGVAWGGHTVLERAREKGREEVRLEWRTADLARVEAETKLAAAQNATREMAMQQGEQREKTIKDSATALAGAAASLRSTVANQQTQLATASAETARRYSIVASTVFTECADRYRSVAEAAERSASTARTLSEAWPTAPAETPPRR
jgi:hypothetical protein